MHRLNSSIIVSAHLSAAHDYSTIFGRVNYCM
jgi:hypothetical protein